MPQESDRVFVGELPVERFIGGEKRYFSLLRQSEECRVVDLLYVEVLRFGVVDDDGGGGLFRHQLVFLRETDADPLGVEERKQLRLIVQVGAGGGPERVPAPTVFLVEPLADFRVILPLNLEFLPDAAMPVFGERFGGLDA